MASSMTAQLSQLLRIDELCEEFEYELRAGRQPRVEAFLERVPVVERGALLLELIPLDVHAISNLGDALSANTLCERYARLLTGAEVPFDALRSTIERALVATAGGGADRTQTFHGDISATPPGAPHIEGFDIEVELGQGGMGVVYKAWQHFPRRPVALKMMLKPYLPGDSVAGAELTRFRSEAQAVADLKDPRFVQIYGFGEVARRPYMVLEYVDGGSLRDYCRNEPQSIEFAVPMVAKLAAAMQVAHDARMVHRDLKPHNVLLTASGEPKIADFGLVKRLNDDLDLTADGMVVGTAQYMAPEQTYADGVDAAADTYALGAILYYLLTGRPPFQGKTWGDIVPQVRYDEPVAPSRLNPKVSRDLETICLKCLRKEPSRRYLTAGELAADLGRLERGEPIHARPVRMPERAWRWARRNPWIAGLGSSVAALVIAIAIGSTVMTLVLQAQNRDILRKSEEIGTKALEISAKNTQLVQKTNQLTEARNNIQGQRDQSLELVRSVLLDIDNGLRDAYSVDLQKTRKGILAAAHKSLTNLRDAIAAQPLDHVGDGLVERTEGMAHQRMGEMYLTTGNISEAAREYEHAAEILERRFVAAPTDGVSLHNLANICVAQGEVELRRGNIQGARELYERVLALRKRWVELAPDHEAASWAVAKAHGLLAKVAMMRGATTERLAHLQAGQQLYDALSTPTIPAQALELYRERAAQQQRLGEAWVEAGDFEQGEQALRKSLDMRRAAPANLSPRIRAHDEALSHTSLGDFYLMVRDDPQLAWRHYSDALFLFIRIANGKMESIAVVREMAAMQYRLGTTFRRAHEQNIKTLPDGKPTPDPLTHFHAARTYRNALANIDPSDLQLKIEQLLALARCGTTNAGETLMQELDELAHGDKERYLLFQLACAYAICSEDRTSDFADAYRARAFRVLETLLDSGWRNRVALERDPDLVALRAEPRWEELRRRWTDEG